MYFNLRRRVWERFNYISVSIFLLNQQFSNKFPVTEERYKTVEDKLLHPATNNLHKKKLSTMCIVTAYMIFNIFAIPQRARNMDKSLFI